MRAQIKRVSASTCGLLVIGRRALRMTDWSDMHRNTLPAQRKFSFKGEDYALEATPDLDQCLAESGQMPNVHFVLARAGNIDTLSYLYEVLESYDVAFDQPTGLAVACCSDGVFDWPGFVQQSREQRDLQTVRALVAQTLEMDEFDARPELRAALLAAYRAGREPA